MLANYLPSPRFEGQLVNESYITPYFYYKLKFHKNNTTELPQIRPPHLILQGLEGIRRSTGETKRHHYKHGCQTRDSTKDRLGVEKA